MQISASVTSSACETGGSLETVELRTETIDTVPFGVPVGRR